MQPSREDILGKQNPDRRIGVILAHTKKPDGLAVIDLLHELGLKSKDRSGLNDNHLKKLVKAGVLEECQAITEHGERTKKRQLDAHRLNQDLDTFAELLNTFIGTEYAEEFLKSAYVGSFSTDDLEISRIVFTAIIDKLKTVHLVCDAFYPGLPLTKSLDVLLAPSPFNDLTEEELYDMCATSTNAFLNELTKTSTAIDAFINHTKRKEAERIASGRPRVDAATREGVLQTPVKQRTIADRLTLANIRLDEGDEKKQLPPPKTVQ